MVFETLKVTQQEAVLFVEIAAPPMNLLGPVPPLRGSSAIGRGWSGVGSARFEAHCGEL